MFGRRIRADIYTILLGMKVSERGQFLKFGNYGAPMYSFIRKRKSSWLACFSSKGVNIVLVWKNEVAVIYAFERSIWILLMDFREGSHI